MSALKYFETAVRQRGMQTSAVAERHRPIVPPVEEQHRTVTERREQWIEISPKQTLLCGADIAGNAMLHIASPGTTEIPRHWETT